MTDPVRKMLLVDGLATGYVEAGHGDPVVLLHGGDFGISADGLGLADGTMLDYSIAGTDVDCKFSHWMGRWMIPPEASGQLVLLVQASDEDGTWSAGLLRVSLAISM